MEKLNGLRTFNPANRNAWRTWLKKNHTSVDPVGVVIFNKASGTPNLSYADAVEEALCFGWIDNKGIKRDGESMYLQFTPRKKNGNWSMLNRERASRMSAEGKMTDAGQVFIDEAKASGKWDAALNADVVPDDLLKAFRNKKKAFQNFSAFAPSSRRLIIQWIAEAKKSETRVARIEKTVILAAKNMKAKSL